MSKLDREIKAIIDDMASQAQELVPKMLAILVDDELSEDELNAKLAKVMEDSRPKTYDIYIADLKQVFREAGWVAPKGEQPNE